jgi:hypothetical protein
MDSAEATPVHEAERLQTDLRRAQIEPFTWVINQSLLASGTRDPVLALRGRYEALFIDRVASHSSRRVALLPWRTVPPVGANEHGTCLEANLAQHRSVSSLRGHTARVKEVQRREKVRKSIAVEDLSGHRDKGAGWVR